MEANCGDSPWWCALDARKFEAGFLAPPATVSDAQFRAWVDDYDASHPYSLEDRLDSLDALCPLQGGSRRLDGPKAGMVLYHLCVHQCGVSAHRGRHQKSPARTLVDLSNDRALARAELQPLLEQAGFDYAWFRDIWRLLCKTAGFDLDSGGATPRPAWLRAAAGNIAGYAGLLDPADVRRLATLATSSSVKSFHDALAIAARKFDCSQDADDLKLVVELAPTIASRGDWLLSVQSST